jgi:hypothetical protein
MSLLIAALQDAPPAAISRRSYLVLGALCLAAGIPSWILLAGGRLFAGRDPNLLIPFSGVPAGLMLLLFAANRFHRTQLSDNGFRVALIAVSVGVCGVGSWIGARLGATALLTALRFCTVAASYLAFFSFGLLIVGAAKGKRTS